VPAGDCSRSPYLEKDGTLWWGIAAGLLFTAEFILVYWGLEFTNASRAIIFLNISPFVVALGAQLFIPGEQLRMIQVVGLCCAFAGIVVAFSESASYTSYRMTSADLRLTNCGCRFALLYHFLFMDGLFIRPLEPLNPKPSVLAEESWLLQPLNL
jgi:hypothetical protein